MQPDFNIFQLSFSLGLQIRENVIIILQYNRCFYLHQVKEKLRNILTYFMGEKEALNENSICGTFYICKLKEISRNTFF